MPDEPTQLHPVEQAQRQPARRPRVHGPRNVGLSALMVHASVSILIGTYVFILVLTRHLSNDVALGLFGTIVGAHVTAASATQLHRRTSDPPENGG